MSIIRILTQRIPKMGKERMIKKYTGDLSRGVQGFQGFKNATSYWETSCSLKGGDKSLLTISEWENYNCWNNWLKYEKRIKIHNKYKVNLKEEKHIVLSKICYNIPLL